MRVMILKGWYPYMYASIYLSIYPSTTEALWISQLLPQAFCCEMRSEIYTTRLSFFLSVYLSIYLSIPDVGLAPSALWKVLPPLHWRTLF